MLSFLRLLRSPALKYRDIKLMYLDIKNISDRYIISYTLHDGILTHFLTRFKGLSLYAISLGHLIVE